MELDKDGKTLTVYMDDANSTTVILLRQPLRILANLVITLRNNFLASGGQNLGLSGSGDFYEDGATAEFTSTLDIMEKL